MLFFVKGYCIIDSISNKSTYMAKYKINKNSKRVRINSQRLSRYINSREVMRTTDFLVGLYDVLTVKQRAEIKLLLNSNANKQMLIKNKNDR